jgi:hypothetical protein
LPLWKVTGALREEAELVIEALEDRIRRVQLDAGRHELDGQRHPSESGRDASDRSSGCIVQVEARLYGSRASDEEPDGFEPPDRPWLVSA